MLGENILVQNRYLVKNLIGRGGMGAVYRVEDLRFNNRVIALKEMVFVNNPSLETAFSREANLLAQLHHPRLPKVSDYFKENGSQYLVMEYVGGEDVEKLLKRNGKPFPLNRVLHWADSLLEILEYLHQQNPPVIHRDIKPENLKLNSEDKIILLDFGLAKDMLAPISELAHSKSLVGFTPNFAPLEQIRGDRTTIQTDLYAFTATIYHLLTNVAPASSLNRAQAKIDDALDPLVPAHQLNPEIPVKLSELLTYGLTLKQEGRPHSASEMRRVVREIIAEQKKLQELPTRQFNYNQNEPQNQPPVAAEPVMKISFPPQSAAAPPAPPPVINFPAKTMVSVEPPKMNFTPAPNTVPKSSENRNTGILFGALVGVLGVGIIATFFVGQWISAKMNPVNQPPPEVKTSVQENNTAVNVPEVVTSGNSSLANKAANTEKPENKAPVEPKIVQPKKPQTKPIAPKLSQKPPTENEPGPSTKKELKIYQ